jgi:DNA-binding transcriptional LysR family regulator
VRIRDLDRREILQGIEAGEVDLGLGAFFKPVAGIERQPLATFQMVRVSARAPRAKGGKSGNVPWSALAGDHLLTLSDDNPIQNWWTRSCVLWAFHPVAAGRCKTFKPSLRWSKQGMGWQHCHRS